MVMGMLPVSVVIAIIPMTAFFVGPAAASCGVPPPLKSAISDGAVVFVGTVTSLENSDRWATVQVEEVWKGEDIPVEVEVRAGPKDPPGPISSITTVDRDFEPSKRYLFFPYERDGSIFEDNACTRTAVFKPRFEKFRPESVDIAKRAPNDHEVYGPAQDPEKDGAPRFLMLGVVAATVLAGASWFVYRMARRT